jgi:4-amino-4-deoxy-L-arabinose transferase-like glycosyltransferase
MEASDELWHYPMVKTIADHWALPVQVVGAETAWRQEGSQPPLYYVLSAVLTAWIDTSDLERVRWLNPHADNGVITEDGNTNLIVHTPASDLRLDPSASGLYALDGADGGWRGTVLAIHVIRLFSVAMGAGTVYLGYRLALALWPGREILALVAAALTAFNPMFLFISGAVNNDNLAMLLCALGIWLLVRLVGRHARDGSASRRAWWIDVSVLGLVLGAAVLTKTSAMGLLLLTALSIAYVAWKRRSWPFFLGGGAITAGLVAGIAGWWFLRNARLYDGDWLGLQRFIEVLGYRVPPATLRQLWGERHSFLMAYWGLFGGVNVPLPGWAYALLNGALVLSGIGLLVRLVCQLCRFRFRVSSWSPSLNLEPETFNWLLLALWPAIVLLSWAGWATKTWSSQGRLVFSAITAWSAWMAWGLSQLLSRRWSAMLPGLVALFLFCVAAWAPWGVIAPAYRPSSILADTDVHPTYNLRADVGGQLRLLGYDVENSSPAGRASLRPGEALRFTLYWEAQGEMDRDWSIFCHVLDADLELPIAVRDRFPGQGLLATTLMEPGLRWADRYVIWLDETIYAPSRALLEVGLYDAATGERPPIQVEEVGDLPDQPQVVDNALRFLPVQIESRPGNVPNPLGFRLEDGMALLGWDVDRRLVAAGETLQLTLYWEGLKDVRQDYQVTTQLVREDRRKAAQFDVAPGGIPTSKWRKGQQIVDRRELQIEESAPAGGYKVVLSAYWWDTPHTIKRLRIVDAEGYVLPSDSLVLGWVRVTP